MLYIELLILGHCKFYENILELHRLTHIQSPYLESVIQILGINEPRDVRGIVQVLNFAFLLFLKKGYNCNLNYDNQLQERKWEIMSWDYREGKHLEGYPLINDTSDIVEKQLLLQFRVLSFQFLTNLFGGTFAYPISLVF